MPKIDRDQHPTRGALWERTLLMVGLTTLAACALNPGPETARAKGRPAASELELFARRAVEDRLAAGDLPDMELLEDSRRISVRREMPLAGLELGPATRPEVVGLKLDLVSQAALQERADRLGLAVFFIGVDRPVISGDTATIALGVDIAVPTRSGPYLCCCTGEARFRRAEPGWTFEEWESVWCR